MIREQGGSMATSKRRSVHVQDRALWVDGRRVSLVGGELHYWRVPRSVWPAILDAAGEMGVGTLSSYTAWHIHEYQVGKFDFQGKTAENTDLVGYLEVVQASGRDLVLRPGPYIFAEWDNYGIPDRLVPYHRQHPVFMDAAATYIRAVCDVIVPFLATNGGPIVALQIDNMFDLGKDRYDRDLGLFGGDGPFQAYLKRKYASSIAALNAAWQAQYQAFEEIVATTALPPPSPGRERRLLDYLEFREWYTAECARWTADLYREHGIDLPLYSNATRDQAMASMQASVDFMSINFYPTEGYARQGEHQRLLDDVRLLSAVSPLPYVAELHSGTWHGYHYDKRLFQPSDAEFSWISTVAAGAAGWNWYMLHDRDNWYMSPLNSSGRPRHELAAVIRRCAGAEQDIQPWRWQRLARTGLTYYHRHHAMRHGRTDDQTTTREVGRALYDSGVDYTFFLLGDAREGPQLLFYDGDEWLDMEGYDALATYVESGGNLVFFQSIPYFDEDRHPANPLGIVPPDGVQSQGYMNTFHRDLELDIGDQHVRLPTPASAYVYRSAPGTPLRARLVRPISARNDNVLDEYQQITALGDGAELVIGYTQRRGACSLSVVGVPPAPELITALHAHLGVGIPAVPLTRGVQVALYRSDDSYYLVALNNDDHEKVAPVAVTLDGSTTARYGVRSVIGARASSERRECSRRELAGLPVALAAKSGAILEIRPVAPDVARGR